ncbi:hypothetical protein GF377_03995, partial [candidate division GN15 bacterium]|nr:hypothetical protein [candidate division GN15 bacterium]
MVLAFHKVWPGFTYGATNYTPDKLKRLLLELQAAGFELTDSARARESFVLLTFDDAYDHLREVLPEMIERFGCRPLVFVPTAHIGGPNS